MSEEKKTDVDKTNKELRSAQVITDQVRALLGTEAPEASNDDLFAAAKSLEAVVLDNYQAWRAQADVLLAALRKLETRQIEPDETIKVLGVVLRENDLRDAAEAALRNCAHFAESVEQHIGLIDEANRVRRTTWF